MKILVVLLMALMLSGCLGKIEEPTEKVYEEIETDEEAEYKYRGNRNG